MLFSNMQMNRALIYASQRNFSLGYIDNPLQGQKKQEIKFSSFSKKERDYSYDPMPKINSPTVPYEAKPEVTKIILIIIGI